MNLVVMYCLFFVVLLNSLSDTFFPFSTYKIMEITVKKDEKLVSRGVKIKRLRRRLNRSSLVFFGR